MFFLTNEIPNSHFIIRRSQQYTKTALKSCAITDILKTP